MYKINQYTIDAVQSFTFLKRTIENFFNVLNHCYKNVSFAFLNRWNVTSLTKHEAHVETGDEGCILLVQMVSSFLHAFAASRGGGQHPVWSHLISW